MAACAGIALRAPCAARVRGQKARTVVRVARAPIRVIAATGAQSDGVQPRSSARSRSERRVLAPRMEEAMVSDEAPRQRPQRRAAPLLALRIDGEWYDCSAWAREHPGGASFMALFNGRDATAIFYALHSYGANGSDAAAKHLAALPRCAAPAPSPTASAAARASVAASLDLSSEAVAFQALRVALERDGFFERSAAHEAFALASVLGLYGAASVLAHSAGELGPAADVAASVLLGLGMQQAGWLSHDYAHGRGPLCSALRDAGALLNGHSATWWTAKHSAHHTFTNTHGLDEDVTQEPVFFLEHPKATGRPDASGGLRRFQHLYAYPVYCITFWVWRVASVADVVRRRDAREAALLAANAAATLALVPWPVAAAGVTIGGFLVGALVSATHQSEEIVAERRDDFVLAQFASTRDADASASPLLAWLWGGMDTQLEHHLFPSMPRYKYAALRPRLQAWAAEHNIEFRISDWKDILRDNYATLRAAAAAEPAARSSA